MRPERPMKYLNQYRILHQSKNYGVTGGYSAPLVNTDGCKSVLDYGCGRSDLVNKLDIPLKYRYDPAIPEYNNKPPTTVDLVTCTDVLEHIPEDELDDFMEDIKSCGRKFFFNVCTRLAHEILPNGDNAHCTVKPVDWWVERLKEHFDNVTEVKRTHESGIFTCDKRV